MQVFSADATIFFQKILSFKDQKLKKPPSKVAKTQLHFFFLTAWTAQTEEFTFQNVAYRPTVYRTGVATFLVYKIGVFVFAQGNLKRPPWMKSRSTREMTLFIIFE